MLKYKQFPSPVIIILLNKFTSNLLFCLSFKLSNLILILPSLSINMLFLFKKSKFKTGVLILLSEISIFLFLVSVFLIKFLSSYFSFFLESFLTSSFDTAFAIILFL